MFYEGDMPFTFKLSVASFYEIFVTNEFITSHIQQFSIGDK